jgi:hypothetical protein
MMAITTSISTSVNPARSVRRHRPLRMTLALTMVALLVKRSR